MTADHVQAERQNNMATKKAVAKTPAIKKPVAKKVAVKTPAKKTVAKTAEKKPVAKKTAAKKSKYPIVTVGSHSVRTEYENGRVDFVVDDAKLQADVYAALAEFEASKVTEQPKKTRTKKAKA